MSDLYTVTFTATTPTGAKDPGLVIDVFATCALDASHKVEALPSAKQFEWEVTNVRRVDTATQLFATLQ